MNIETGLPVPRKFSSGRCIKTGYKGKDAKIHLKVIWTYCIVTNLLLLPESRFGPAVYPNLPTFGAKWGCSDFLPGNPDFISMFRGSLLVPRRRFVCYRAGEPYHVAIAGVLASRHTAQLADARFGSASRILPQ